MFSESKKKSLSMELKCTWEMVWNGRKLHINTRYFSVKKITTLTKFYFDMLDYSLFSKPVHKFEEEPWWRKYIKLLRKKWEHGLSFPLAHQECSVGISHIQSHGIQSNLSKGTKLLVTLGKPLMVLGFPSWNLRWILILT